MKLTLKAEEAALFMLALVLFRPLGMSGWWFAAFFLAPDLGMLGYLANPRLGALTYNLLHHKGLAVLLYLAGLFLDHEWLQFTGLLLLAHASFDRALGYGLKYPDSFHHTHLGYIGKVAAGTKEA